MGLLDWRYHLFSPRRGCLHSCRQYMRRSPHSLIGGVCFEAFKVFHSNEWEMEFWFSFNLHFSYEWSEPLFIYLRTIFISFFGEFSFKSVTYSDVLKAIAMYFIYYKAHPFEVIQLFLACLQSYTTVTVKEFGSSPPTPDNCCKLFVC